jgi:intracellular septation protein
MNQLLEWSPLLIFFVVFKRFSIYEATASLMVTCTAVMLIHRARSGRFKPMHVVTVVTVMVLGSATLWLHDKRFIQWKPTVVLGLMALAFLGSAVIGEKPLARRMFEGVFNAPLELSRGSWLSINTLWVGWLALLALANLYVAHNFTESVWVNFKVFGIMAAMVLFMLTQVVWLNGKIRPAAPDAAPP